MTRVLYLTFAILVALIGLGLHVRNDAMVEVDYLFGTIDITLSWVLVAALVVGAMIGVIGMTATVLRLRYANRRLSRRNERVEREVANLRAHALKDAD